MPAAWVGKAVPVNRKGTIGKKWSGGSKVSIIRTTETYQNFIFELSLAFRSLPKLGARQAVLNMTACLGNLADMDGIIKPVFDSLQRAKIVDNDQQFRELHYRCYEHARGKPDIIIVDVEEATWDPKIFPTMDSTPTS
jgi:hypothetical protein